jgi:hypothetical protein
VVKTSSPVSEDESKGYVRKITDIYRCDPEGIKISAGSSKNIAFDLATGYEVIMTIPGLGNIGAAIDGSSPFSYNMETGYNSWADLASYTVELAEGRTIRLGNTRYKALRVPAASYADRLVPESALFTKGTSTLLESNTPGKAGGLNS